MNLSLNLNPFFAKKVNPFSIKSEPILQNEPIRILYPFRSPFTKITDGVPTIRYFFIACFVSKLKAFSDFYHSPKRRPFFLKKYAFAKRSPN